jgi:hypothetical protein
MLLAALLGGWILPLLLVVALYAGVGQLSALVYWFVTYNRDVYMGPYGPGSLERELLGWLKSHGTIALALVVVLLGGVQRVVPTLIRRDRTLFSAYRSVAFEATCTLQAAFALIGTIMPLRFWTQYELPPVPWVGNWVYRQIARNRPIACEIAPPEPLPAGPWREILGRVGGSLVTPMAVQPSK